jgi:CheY-like chemotaxis protein
MPARRESAVVLLVQPGDDGVHMYAEFLSDHGLAVTTASDARDALIVAAKADVIVTGILLARRMDGVEARRVAAASRPAVQPAATSAE